MRSNVKQVQTILSATADAIRDRTATFSSYYASDYASLVRNIPNFGNVKSTLINILTDQLSEITIPSGITSELKINALANTNTLERVYLNNVTVVPSSAFYNCVNLSYVYGSAVTQLKSNAFGECTNLSDVSLPQVSVIGSAAFAGCTKLSSFNFDNIERIEPLGFYRTGFSELVINTPYVGDAAFNNCSNLTKVILYEVTSLHAGWQYSEGNTFAYCQNLREFRLPKCTFIANSVVTTEALDILEIPEARTIGTSAFSTVSSIGNWGTTISLSKCISISGSAFNKYLFTNISLPNVTYLGDCAFGVNSTQLELPALISCGGGLFNIDRSYSWASDAIIKKVSFPQLLSAANYNFHGCEKLTSVTLPRVSYLGESAFYSCKLLTQLSLPNLETLSGERQFSNCYVLSDIYAPRLTNISNRYYYSTGTFQGLKISSAMFSLLTQIPSRTFKNCSQLIDTDFAGCIYLMSEAFNNCSEIEKLSFPALMSISGGSVFANCTKLSQVILYTSDCSLNFAFNSTFYNTPMLDETLLSTGFGSILVPAKYLDSYKVANNWSVYSARIASLPASYDDKNIYTREYFRNYDLTAIPASKINAISVWSYAFYQCSNLGGVDLPHCEVIYYQAFRDCKKISYINLPKVSYIGNANFYSCSLLTSASIAKNTIIDTAAFQYCSKLVDITNLEDAKYLGKYAFANCYSLGYNSSIMKLLNCDFISAYCFNGCSNIKQICINDLTIYDGTFLGCSSLSRLYMLGGFFVVSSYNNMYIFNNSNIDLYFYSTSLIGTNTSSIFYQPSSYIGNIYVRQSLVSDYQNNVFWSWYSSRFVGLTDQELNNIFAPLYGWEE